MKKVAVVGAGYWGKNHVRIYYNLGVLHSVCDTNNDALNAIKNDFPDICVTREFDEVLDSDDVKAVVIALPAEQHYEYARKALQAGKDVFVEKPLALELDDARELIRLSSEGNRILMVGHLLRYHPAFLKLKELVDNGDLGRIEYIYSNRLSLGKIRREENALWSFAPHDISMILALCNEVPEHVSAVGHSYLHKHLADVTTTHLSFPSGVNGHILVSWLHPFKEQKLIVIGDKKMALFEDTQPWEKKLTIYSHTIKWEMSMPVPTKGDPEFVPTEEKEPLQEECLHFLRCIDLRESPITDGNEGYRVLEVLDHAQKSMENFLAEEKKLPATDRRFSYFAHPSAIIDDSSRIGDGSKIWHFSHVMKGAHIGNKCSLGQNVHIGSDVKIGNNVKIQNNVSVYTGCEIEDDVFLGPSCVLTNVTNPRSEIVRRSLYEKTVIKKGASIGANATIVCGITIGRYAFIAAGAVVTKDVADYALMVGTPARQKGWMSRHGIKLSMPDSEGIMVCPESGLKYRELEEGVLRCLDLDEEASLPVEMAIGSISYDELKTKTVKSGGL
ncbi:MAG: oxidoreductase [Deltaproteobacteria bacterium]|nr:oxidoreductase [Deltaproteobacteria bacterium]TLN00937.1 MAG: oxidoreductase [bacterium]